jgi:hypothetical protein
MDGTSRSKREHLREQIFDLRKNGMRMSAIARLLQLSRQRVSSILKSGRTRERKRGLGSNTDETARKNAKPASALSHGLCVSIFCVLQSIRNTCLEHGFRFNVNHSSLAKAIEHAYGLTIPVRTLRTYRFQSAKLHNLPDPVFGISRLPSSPHMDSAIEKGMHCEHFFGNSVLGSHDLDKAIIIDRRNRLTETLHNLGTSICNSGPFLMLPFFTENPHLNPQISKRQQQRLHLKRCFCSAKKIRDTILDLFNDPDLGISTERSRRELGPYLHDFLDRITRPPYLLWRTSIHERSQLGCSTIIIKEYQAGFDAFLPLREDLNKGLRLHRGLERVYKRINTTNTDLPIPLQGLSAGEIHQRRKALYAILRDHGWDSSRHPGNPKDNQLLHHK